MKRILLSALMRSRPICVIVCLAFAMGAVAAQPADFTLPDLDGQPHTLSDYRGKWVVVNYWATWCPPCLEELPELEVFHRTHPERAVVLGVNMESIGDRALRAFVARQALSFPILVAGESPALNRLVGPVPGLPTTYLVAPSGEPVARQVGQITAAGVKEFIERYEGRNDGR